MKSDAAVFIRKRERFGVTARKLQQFSSPICRNVSECVVAISSVLRNTHRGKCGRTAILWQLVRSDVIFDDAARVVQGVNVADGLRGEGESGFLSWIGAHKYL